MHSICSTKQGGYFEYKPMYIQQIPIKDSKDNKACHDRMLQLVEQMLFLHKQLSEVKTAHEQTLIQRQIDATDKQIDKLVYELYELTEEEITARSGNAPYKT